MSDGQIGALVMFGLMALAAGVLTILDSWAQRRQHRREHNQPR